MWNRFKRERQSGVYHHLTQNSDEESAEANDEIEQADGGGGVQVSFQFQISNFEGNLHMADTFFESHSKDPTLIPNAFAVLEVAVQHANAADGAAMNEDPLVHEEVQAVAGSVVNVEEMQVADAEAEAAVDEEAVDEEAVDEEMVVQETVVQEVDPAVVEPAANQTMLEEARSAARAAIEVDVEAVVKEVAQTLARGLQAAVQARVGEEIAAQVLPAVQNAVAGVVQEAALATAQAVIDARDGQEAAAEPDAEIETMGEEAEPAVAEPTPGQVILEAARTAARAAIQARVEATTRAPQTAAQEEIQRFIEKAALDAVQAEIAAQVLPAVQNAVADVVREAALTIAQAVIDAQEGQEAVVEEVVAIEEEAPARDELRKALMKAAAILSQVEAAADTGLAQTAAREEVQGCIEAAAWAAVRGEIAVQLLPAVQNAVALLVQEAALAVAQAAIDAQESGEAAIEEDQGAIAQEPPLLSVDETEALFAMYDPSRGRP